MNRAWYRSLYWRIGLGFILCVAGLLIAQILLFLWLAGRSGGGFARSPDHLATVVASDLSEALEADPQLDIGAFLRTRFGEGPHRIGVALDDGRTATNGPFRLPEWFTRSERRRLLRRAPMAQRDGQGRPRRILTRPVVVDGETVGHVIVFPGGTPPGAALRQFGPTLALTGLALLLLGTATMAFFVFRPVQRRLLALERAADALGAGASAVRAPEYGGDEVSALARAFNRMASDLETRVQERRESDRVRRQLLADVSHELTTPLTAIRGYLETLAMPGAADEPAARERYLRIVTEETRRLEAIIGDLLDLARLESGGTTLQRSRVAVEELFSRAEARHGAALQEKNITMTTQVADEAAVVEGDARRLEQVVQNLVANAVRHTPDGGRITLEATAEQQDDRHMVRLRICDTGAGIPPEHLPRIFDRFYRADAARDQASGGSGLGLSIVRAIVEAHGGTVTASNAPGGGASFDMWLPAPGR